jgi:predicted lipid-binding transport protein (Tim44 family)
MTKSRLRLPVGLFIAIVVTFVLGLVANPVIKALTTPKQRATNVLLSAIPFILIFVAILLVFISLINMSASVLNDNISPRIFRAVERVLIAGIALGIFGMFQPWLMILYKYGFIVLLVSTLGFIWWSHIKPKRERRQKETASRPGQDLKTIEL